MLRPSRNDQESDAWSPISVLVILSIITALLWWSMWDELARERLRDQQVTPYDEQLDEPMYEQID